MRSTITAAVLFALSASASPVAEADALFKRNACQAQPLGAGPVSSPDTPDAFARNPVYNQVANSAVTPKGYVATFKAHNASNNAKVYLTFQTVKKYDPSLCAAKCDSIKGCKAFNIYYERNPVVNPGPDCPNPKSTTNIKCAYWGSDINLGNAVNYGQWRQKFQVLISGSNGYSLNPYPGYTVTPLGNSTINAPNDCNGANTYLQMKTFQVAAFDASLCTQACTDQTAYNLANGGMLCNFVTAWMQLRNGKIDEQHCALYNQTWDASFSTNFGQMQGNDVITVTDSFAFSNSANPGVCVPAAPDSTTSSTVIATLIPATSTVAPAGSTAY